MSKIDVDQTIHDLKRAKRPNGSLTTSEYIARAGAPTGIWQFGRHPASPALPVAHHNRPTFRREAHLTRAVWNCRECLRRDWVERWRYTHPNWYLNLRANPVVEVQVANDRFQGRARVATGKERDQIWRKMTEEYPLFSEYQKKTKRQIPVIRLEKQ
jgi:F420H(2)-dependent quinone reductase